MKIEKEFSLLAIAILLSAIALQIPSSDPNARSSERSGLVQASPGQRGPRSDTIRLKVTRSPAAQLIEMTSGYSEVWTGLNRPSDIEEMERQGKITSSRGGFHYCQIGMNYRVAPLSDANYRNALSYLVPKDRIIGSLFRYLVVKVNTPVPPAQSLWYNAQVDPHAYSPATAQAILGQTAGAYEKVGGVWKYDADHGGGDLETLRFYVPLNVTAPTTYTIGRMIVEEAQAIGLNNIVLTPMDFATYLDLVYNQWNFELFWVCYSLSRFPTHLWSLFNSINNFPGSSNPYGINYPDLDAATTILWTSLDHDAKVAAAQTAQELLMGGTTTNPMPLYVAPTDPRSQALPVFAIYSRNYYDVEQPYIRGAVNMFGYGIDNTWTRMNIYKTEPGTTGDINTVVYIEEEFPERLNPLFASTTYARDFFGDTFDHLMAVNPYTHADMPWLATAWSYEAVSGGMDVTFDLRLTDSSSAPIQWQDGDAVSASDVQFAWDFLGNEQIPNYWGVFQYYAGSTIIDADTIVAHMTTTSQWYVYNLADVAYMLPPQVWSDTGVGHAPWPTDATRLATILGWDPSASAYPDPDGAGPLRAVPTCLFGTGPFINVHSTATIGTQAYGDLAANRNYWMETAEIDATIEYMFWKAGDAVDNDRVDMEDRDLIASWMGESVPPAPAEADITEDGVVNIFDAATAGKFFGETETVLLGGGTPSEPHAPAPVVYINPPLVTNAFVGETFSVDIEIDDAVDLHLWETDLYYDEDIIFVTSITEGSFMSSAGDTWFSATKLAWGHYLIGCFLTYGDAASGDGTLATATFEVRKEGKSPIEFRDTTKLRDPSLDPIARTTEDGLYQTYAAKVWVEPETIIGSSLQAGEIFTVDVMVADVHDLYVWQAGITFDPAVVEALSVSEGEFLTRAGVTTLWTPGTIDNVSGEISYSACSLTGPAAGVTGSGQLMSIDFEVKATGNANLNLADVLLLDSSLTSITPLKTMWETHAQILNVGFKVGETVRYFYVNEFTADYTDWTTVGASPYLGATGDGNYIEGQNHCELMGSFGFQDIRLGPYNKIKNVILEGYTQAADTDIDYDMYSPDFSYWYGSLWGSTSYTWKTPRSETRPISEINPSVLTQTGFNDFKVVAHYYTSDGLSYGYARLDALRLKVVMDVAEGPVEVYPTWTQPLTIGVTVKNQGTETETFEVSVYADTITIGTQTVELAANAQADLEFDWSLGSVPEGLYMIRATAKVIEGDTDTPDCLFLASTVKVKHPGDANGDTIVNGYDLGTLAKAWGTQPGDALWDPRADFNGDLIINTEDHDILKAYWP